MILGMEIALTVLGIFMLATGRTMGKNAVRHWEVRLMGGLALTLLPVVMIATFGYGVIWALRHPEASAERLHDETRLTITLIELGVVGAYVVGGTLWERSIRRRVGAEKGVINGSEVR